MIGGIEWILLILIVVALLFGAKKIPELARSLGRAKAEFQRGQIMVQREIDEEKAKYEEEKQKKNARSKTKQKSNKVIKAAEALGIDTEGKTDSQLKKEIAEKVAQ